MRKTILLFLTIFELLMCTYANSSKSNNQTRKKVFYYLKSQNEFTPERNYPASIYSFFIYDLHTKKKVIKEKCICVFGVYDGDNNYYLFIKNGSSIEFFNPAKIKLNEVIERLPIIFNGKYPYKYDLIIKDISSFFKGNTNTIIFIN